MHPSFNPHSTHTPNYATVGAAQGRPQSSTVTTIARDATQPLEYIRRFGSVEEKAFAHDILAVLGVCEPRDLGDLDDVSFF